MSVYASSGIQVVKLDLLNMSLINKFHKKMFRIPFIRWFYIKIFNEFQWINIKKLKEKKLHLGCGQIKLEGFINIDVENWAGACDLVMNCTNLKRFADQSVDYIFNHALLEHIAPYKTVPALKEWNRVLKLNGRILIEVPDLERIFEDWLVKKKLSEQEAINNIFGGNKRERGKFLAQDHLTGFTYERLCRFLSECGFSEFKRLEHKRYHHILCIEAKKTVHINV